MAIKHGPGVFDFPWHKVGMTVIYFWLALAALFIGAGSLLAQTSPPDHLPAAAKRLDTEAIKELLGTGATFEFTGADGQTTGTSTWNLNTGTAYGVFQWNGKIKGTWNVRWKVEDDLSGLENAPTHWECEKIFSYGNGFFEVDDNGTIHTFTTPRTASPLPEPLNADAAAAMFPAFMNWALKLDLKVRSAHEADGIITLDVVDDKGSSSTYRISSTTGLMLSAN